MIWAPYLLWKQIPLLLIRTTVNAHLYIQDIKVASFCSRHPRRPVLSRYSLDLSVSRVSTEYIEQAILSWASRSANLFPIKHVWDMIRRKQAIFLNNGHLKLLRHQLFTSTIRYRKLIYFIFCIKG